MATKEYDFKYLPLEGKLTGKSFEAQTEAAINELGQTVVDVEIQFDGIKETAQQAYDAAKDAQEIADTAKTTADNALEAAQTAQSTADSAQAAANAAQQSADNAQSAADKAQESADESKTAAETAQTDATEALERADTAQSTADKAQQTADTALSEANANSERIANINTEIGGINETKNYEVLGTVDLNSYYTEYARLYVDAESEHAPTNTEKFFVDVDVNSDMTAVRQTATGVINGSTYIRYGVLTENEDSDEDEPEDSEPQTATSGTVIINGDLNADLTVNGNLEVSGEISGYARATGTIQYAGLSGTGTAEENAEIDSCDISVDEGALNFSVGLSEKDGELYCEDLVTNSATTIINCNLTVETKSDVAFINEGNLTVDGTINLYGTSDEIITNEGTIDGTGSIYVNDELYYDGYEEKPDYTVEWGEWTQQGGDEMTVLELTGSTQPERYLRTSGGIDGSWDATASSGSGSSSTTYGYIYTHSGLEAGTYRLRDVIQYLVNMSHTQEYTKDVVSSNCNCDCNCNCTSDCYQQCTDDGEG